MTTPDSHDSAHAHDHDNDNGDLEHDLEHDDEHDHAGDLEHDHDDDHGYDHEHATGVKGWLQSVFRPHSHDSADSVDSALESSERGIRALKVSLVVLLATAVLQGVVVAFSGSVALLADTVHNLSDAGTAIPLWVAFWLGRRPANRRYTYGYGRAEDLAGLFVVLMIAASAVVAGWEAVRRLLDPAPVHNLWWVAAAGLIGFAGNELVAIYRIRVGRDIGSAALVADGLHARTDGVTSLAVVAGAAGVAVGFPLADPLVGLAIMVAILFVLRSAVRDVFARLMDAVDPALIDDAETALARTVGVESVTRVRMRWIGHRLHADADLEVDQGCSAVAAHDVAHRAEEALVVAVPKLTAAVVHAYPAAVHPDTIGAGEPSGALSVLTAAYHVRDDFNGPGASARLEAAEQEQEQEQGEEEERDGDDDDDEGGGMSVDVTVLYFAGCPSWQTALERVHAAAGRVGVPVVVSLQAVETQLDADRLGFTGSPTIWLDGADPFARPDAVPALACRVYATPNGLAGSPTVDQLEDALTRRAA